MFVQTCPSLSRRTATYRVGVEPLLTPTSTGSRAPQGTVLHDYVGEHLFDFCFEHFTGINPVRDFVIKHFDAFFRCGDITADYAILQCSDCLARRTLPLCCKSRAWCPACMTRRQNARALFLHERVIGKTSVRHLALTLPHPLRIYAAYDPSLVTDILSIHISANFRRLKWAAKRLLDLSSVDDAEPGAVTTIQRCSSNLDINLHFHTAMTDGVFHQPTTDGPMTFVPIRPPTDDEIDAVAWEICRRTRDLLVRRGVWEDKPELAADIIIPRPSGPPRILKTVAGTLTIDKARPQQCRFFGTVSQHDTDSPVARDGAQAFNLFARDRVEKGDGKNLRRLLRYMLSPPFTDKQLSRSDDGGIVIDLKRERFDGTTTRHFPGQTFMSKLVQLVPRPNANLIRLHGAWGSNSASRDQVVPQVAEPVEPMIRSDQETPEDYEAWGRFQSRTPDQDVRICQICGGRMKLIELRIERFSYRRKTGTPPDTPCPEPESSDHEIAA